MPRRAKKKIEKREQESQLDFLSLISHKLHTPLAVVHLKASMLLDGTDGELNERQRRSLEEIMRYAQELRWSIEKLLVFSDIDRVGPSTALHPVELSSYVPWAVERIAREVGGGRTRLIVGKIAPDIMLRMNQVYVDLILRNLIENAVKFCDKPEIEVRVSLERQADEAVISVSDNGPGVSQALRERVFEPFYQIEPDASGQVRGIGLGLALVKRLAQAHGGRIEILSELGEGTTVRVKVPAQP